MIKDEEPGIWRAALGAVLATFVKALLVWLTYKFIYRTNAWGYVDLDRAMILIGIFGIPAAAFTGTVVSIILWLVEKNLGRGFGVIGRAIIGGVAVGLVGLLLIYPLTRFSGDNLLVWLCASVYHTDLGLSIGAVAGILDRPQNKRAVKDEATE